MNFPCHTDGGVICTHFLEHILTICIRHPNLCIPSDKRVSLLEIYPEELTERRIKRCIYKAVYHSTVYNCEKMEAANDRELVL